MKAQRPKYDKQIQGFMLLNKRNLIRDLEV